MTRPAKLCATCRQPSQWEEGPQCDPCRMDGEIAAVIELMKFDYPGVADWNCTDAGTVELLDAQDNRIAVITSDALDNYYNHLD